MHFVWIATFVVVDRSDVPCCFADLFTLQLAEFNNYVPYVVVG